MISAVLGPGRPGSSVSIAISVAPCRCTVTGRAAAAAARMRGGGVRPEARGECQHGEAESDLGGDAAAESAGRSRRRRGAGCQAGAVKGGERQHRGDGDELQGEETAVGGVDEGPGAAELDGGEDGTAQHQQADEGKRQPREAAERGRQGPGRPEAAQPAIGGRAPSQKTRRRPCSAIARWSASAAGRSPRGRDGEGERRGAQAVRRAAVGRGKATRRVRPASAASARRGGEGARQGGGPERGPAGGGKLPRRSRPCGGARARPRDGGAAAAAGEVRVQPGAGRRGRKAGEDGAADAEDEEEGEQAMGGRGDGGGRGDRRAVTRWPTARRSRS